MDKISARKTGLKNRSCLSDQERQKKSFVIQNQAIKVIENKKTIGCYVSMRDEADTTGILQYCFDHKKTIAVPKVEGKTLGFYQINSFDDLEPGKFGVMEPKTINRIPVSAIEVMFVPLSSFDSHNHRTGYGRGYYDSVLKESALNIGLAFSVQMVDFIEVDPWDVTLDSVFNA